MDVPKDNLFQEIKTTIGPNKLGTKVEAHD